jgi:hypothetical protein
VHLEKVRQIVRRIFPLQALHIVASKMPESYSNPYDITYGPDENCTLSTCDVRTSLYQYQPSLPSNTIFVVLFGIALVIHVAQGLRWKTWAFMIAMLLGCIAEMVGYGGRLLMHDNPFSFPGFITQIGKCDKISSISINLILLSVYHNRTCVFQRRDIYYPKSDVS